MEGKGYLLMKNDHQDQQLGQGEGLTAVAGGHISMEARVVTSSWYLTR